MDSQDVENLFVDLFDAMANDDEVDTQSFSEFNNSSVRTFSDASLLTRDNGVMLNFEDGSEFQITITQTRRSHES